MRSFFTPDSNPPGGPSGAARSPQCEHRQGNRLRIGFQALVALAALLSAGPSPADPKSASPAPPAETAPGISRERAIGIARAHLDAIPTEKGRGVREAVFVGPHGKSGKGFWLMDLEPYPAGKAAPAKTITSLLIAVETGVVQERGGRTRVDPEQQKAIQQHAERLRAAMEKRKSAD